jgi:hypothetical protein
VAFGSGGGGGVRLQLLLLLLLRATKPVFRVGETDPAAAVRKYDKTRRACACVNAKPCVKSSTGGRCVSARPSVVYGSTAVRYALVVSCVLGRFRRDVFRVLTCAFPYHYNL